MTWIALAGALSCRSPARPGDVAVPDGVRSEVYVWQRRWTPAVADAVRDASFADGFRVFAVSYGGTGDPPGGAAVPVDFGALAATGKPVVLVARVAGPLPVARGVADRLAAAVEVARVHGVPVRGIEVDHDAPVRALEGYGAWLAELRAASPGGLRTTVTALPAWLDDERGLAAVLAAADGGVLQVHAVDPPTRGLFDPVRAERWARAFAERSGDKPFWVALPAYGVYVDPSGAVEAEVERIGVTAGGYEAWADPDEVVKVVRAFDADPPRGFAGTVWFRLRVAGDARAWTGPMLAAVIAGEPLDPRCAVHPGPGTGVRQDLFVVCPGAIGRAPARVAVPGSCSDADGIGPYAVAWDAGAAVLEADAPPLVSPDRPTVIGWIRCGG